MSDRGIDLAQAAIRLVERHLSEDAYPTLDDLDATVDHLDGTKAELKRALAYLACQFHVARTEGDAARSRDAQFALAQIRRAVAEQGAWFDKNHGSGS